MQATLDQHLNSSSYAEQLAALGPCGIVIPAGGAKQLINAYLLINSIREAHQCKLPIQIVYNGPGEKHAMMDFITVRLLWALCSKYAAMHCMHAIGDLSVCKFKDSIALGQSSLSRLQCTLQVLYHCA